MPDTEKSLPTPSTQPVTGAVLDGAEKLAEAATQTVESLASKTDVADPKKSLVEHSPTYQKACSNVAALLNGQTVTQEIDGEQAPLAVGNIKLRTGDSMRSGVDIEMDVARREDIGMHPIEQSVAAMLKKIPGFEDLYDLDKMAKTVETKEIAPAETKAKLEAFIAAHPDRFSDAAKEKLLSWHMFSAGEESRYYAKKGASVAQGENDLIQVHFAISKDAPSPDEQSAVAHTRKNIEARLPEIRQAVHAKLRELNEHHLKEHPGAPLFTAEEMQSLEKLDVVITDAANENWGSDLHAYFGIPKEEPTKCANPWDKLGASPLSKLKPEKLNEILADAILNAGEGAHKVFPLLAGAEDMQREIKRAAEGMEGADAELGFLSDPSLDPKAETSRWRYAGSEVKKGEKPVPSINAGWSVSDPDATRVIISLPLSKDMNKKPADIYKMLAAVEPEKAAAAPAATWKEDVAARAASATETGAGRVN